MIYKMQKDLFSQSQLLEITFQILSDISSKPMIELMNGVSKNFIYQANNVNAKN